MSFYASRFTFHHEPRLELRSINMIPNKISWLSLIFRARVSGTTSCHAGINRLEDYPTRLCFEPICFVFVDAGALWYSKDVSFRKNQFIKRLANGPKCPTPRNAMPVCYVGSML